MKKMYSRILNGLIIPCMALAISQTAHSQSFSEGFENIANLTDWYTTNNSDSPSATFGWGAGNPTTFAAQAGAGYLSCNYQSTDAASGATISNWLFTPSRVYNNGDVITFYTRKPSANFPDRMQVRLSTNGASMNVGTTSASVGDFTNLLLDINPTLVAGGYPITWTQYTITISGLAAPTSGRIAFRYFVTNAGSSAPNSDYIGLDTYVYTSTLPAPINDNCAGATTLTHAATCTPTSGTILGASPSGGIECGDGTANDDVWYKFVATSANAKIIVDGSTNFDAVFEVSSGACGTLTTIACVDNTVADGVESLQLTGLTVGQTYFVRVYDWYDTWPTSFTFNICVQQFTPCTLTQPVGSITETEVCGGTNNDACATPQSISCGTTIWGKTWSSVTNRDVDWYSFTVTTPTSVTLAVQAEIPVNAIFLNIANCANPVQLAAGNMDCTNGTVTYNFTTAGTYGIAIVPQTFTSYACGTSNDYIATLTMTTTTPVLTAGGPTTICTGGSVSLSTTGTGTFAWYNGTTLIPTATTNTYVATASGNYSVVVTNSNGCPSTSNTVTVTVNALDNATFSYGASSYCVNGTNPTPTAATAGTYTSTAGLNFVSATTGQINLATSTAGTYTITHTTTGACPSTSTQSVTINALPIVTATPVSACAGSPAFALTNGSPAGGTYSGTGVTGGQFDPAAGTQTVTYSYTNGNGCSATATATVTVGPLDNATFSYGSSSYCKNGTNPTPTAATAGTYTSTAGLNFVSATTGQINLATSTAGTYIVTHTTAGTCPNTSTQTVTITALDNATFSYGASSYCISGTNPTPTAATAGTYTSTAGLNFVSATTGQINLATSTAGTYTITHATTGACPNTSTQTVTITSTPSASFSYNNAAYCTNATDPSPVLAIGSSAGTFSAGAGLSINASTGVIDLSASTPNTYTVTNSISASGGCPAASATFDVTINALPSITFAPASVCENVPSFALSATPAGGTYTGIGVTGSTFAPSAGTQTINYSYTNANNCTATANALITVTQSTDDFSYAQTDYCESSANPIPTVSGVGTFSASSANLVFASTSTGEIDIANSEVGSYTVTFTSTGSCPNVVTKSINIVQATNAGFSYANADYCLNSTNATPVLATGAVAGTFTSSSGLIFANASTGAINFVASTAGNYTITNSVAASGVCPAVTATFNLSIHQLPTASISGGGAICAGSGDEVDITLNLTGTGPWNVTLNNGTVDIPLLSIPTSPQIAQIDESGEGNYTLVSVTDAHCTNTGTGSITVTVNPLPVITINNIAVCENAAVFTLTNATPAGGTYSGTGVTGNQFNPTVGTQTIAYEYTDANGCTNTETATVTVNTLPTVTFAPASVCNGNAPFTPVASPVNGTFSGTGVTGNLFDPAAGTQTLTYNYTDANNCSASATATITVFARPTATITGGGGTFCQGTSTNVTVALTGTSPWELVINNGTNNNTVSNILTNTYTILASQSGTYTIVSVTDAHCSSSGTGSAVVTVNPLPTVVFPSIAVCDNVETVTLSATPLGGTYSGTGVTGNIFNTLSGTQNVTYTFTNSNNCSGSATATITVNESPTITLSLPQMVCIYGPAFTLTGETPTGGTYFGNGISNNTFNPAVAGLGNQFVNYTYTNSDNCTATAIGNITVSQCLDINESDIENMVSIYPNPAVDFINFKFSAEINTASVKIMSTEGKTVYQNEFQSNQGTLDVQTFARGIYFVHLMVDGKVFTSKFVLN